MDEIIIKDEIKIENMIYEVRGKQVMLDRDLAFLYNVETRVLIQKYKRNIERFPTEFCFQMTDNEFKNWKSQTVMSHNDRIGLRRAPYVFTEPGVAMLSAVIKSDIAINTSIRIINAFVSMRKYISTNLIEQKYLNNQVIKNTEDIKLLQESFKKFEEKKLVNEIYFNGQIYDSYSKIIDIMKEAKKKLIIIDSYADKTVLDMIRKITTKVILITRKNNALNELDISKYQKQYHNLKIINDNTFHDRYIVLDNTTVYHLGTSINHAGSKTFGINILTDEFVINSLINKISKIT